MRKTLKSLGARARMYLDHYGLQEKPFQITADPKFLWLGETHQEALSILKYGIMESKGLLLLTGGVGTGKTVLINALVNEIDAETIVATVPDPDLEVIDFFNFIYNLAFFYSYALSIFCRQKECAIF